MTAAANPQIKVLFDASARDERTLKFDVPDEIFGFHSQQAIEKLFKALITAHGELHPFTHNLQLLSDRLSQMGEQLTALPVSLGELSEYAVEFCYDESAPFRPGVRDQLRIAVANIRSLVAARATELQRTGVQVKQR